MTDFPGRPEHPDFWLLSQALTELDAQSESGQGVPGIISRYLDPESVIYAAMQRAVRARARSDADISRLAGMWIDGLTAGMAVQRLKTAEQEERS